MKKIIYLTFTIIFLGIIFYFSIIPVEAVAGAPSNADKIVHFFMYFFLALFSWKATKKAVLAFFLAGIYGLLIEIIQFTLPYRSFSVFDIIVNFLGAAVLLIYIFAVRERILMPT